MSQSTLPTDSSDLLDFSLPRETAKAFNAFKATDWTEDDWRDLLIAHNWVLKRVAMRHGLLKAKLSDRDEH